VDWPRTDIAQGYYNPDPSDERAGFLAIGPGGVYAVTVADHGRARVLIAGDVVQINGRRPAFVTEARRDAKRASRAMSAAVGLTVPVTPVLAFVGSGVISVHGLPKDCLVATHRELDRLLIAGGARISPSTGRCPRRTQPRPAYAPAARTLPRVRARRAPPAPPSSSVPSRPGMARPGVT